MWGQEASFLLPLYRPRIIPTRVGTSYLVLAYRRLSRDHPHACGDKTSLLLRAFTVQGSSPRVWGQDFFFIAVFIPCRIIPTRVGTSTDCFICGFDCQDHPHACGDKPNRKRKKRLQVGSSPRVWGQAPRFRRGLKNTGIIPTRVGTSNTSVNRINIFIGSSPRVWGQGYDDNK